MGAVGFDYRNSQQVAEEMHAFASSSQSELLPEALKTRAVPLKMPLLIKGPSLYQFGSGTRTSKIFDLQYLTRDPFLEINPEDAKKLGAKSGDPLLIDWDKGRIRSVAKISFRVPPGVFLIAGIECGVSGVKVRRDA
jgi:anaerobic selenocysteine-containing dehydrogenase